MKTIASTFGIFALLITLSSFTSNKQELANNSNKLTIIQTPKNDVVYKCGGIDPPVGQNPKP